MAAPLLPARHREKGYAGKHRRKSRSREPDLAEAGVEHGGEGGPALGRGRPSGDRRLQADPGDRDDREQRGAQGEPPVERTQDRRSGVVKDEGNGGRSADNE